MGQGVALRQRLDKWLWFARVTRTRSLAARLVTGGHVRLNARRIETPAKGVGPGDVLTIALERRVRVLKVVAPGKSRRSFTEASNLFEELPDPGICPPTGPAKGPF
ncbi:MAG TPA: RNA-binding S4 domain-containing protein [Methylocella sp.]